MTVTVLKKKNMNIFTSTETVKAMATDDSGANDNCGLEKHDYCM